MIRMYITDRRSLADPSPAGLLTVVRRAIATGADYIQVREKDLPARNLLPLVKEIIDIARPVRVRTVVNSALDVALAAGADGVHLPTGAPPPSAFRPVAPADFLFTVACHTQDDVERAAQESADYAVFSPIFRPLSKHDTRPPLGLDALRRASGAGIPILALGGVTWENAVLCKMAGAAGIAGISLYQQ